MSVFSISVSEKFAHLTTKSFLSQEKSVTRKTASGGPEESPLHKEQCLDSFASLS